MCPEDFVPQVYFCGWLLHVCVDEPDFPRQILFTDAAKFTKEGVINFCNSHIWADENPCAMHPHGFQQCRFLNMWEQGFWMDVLLGHTFFHLISLVMHAWISWNMYCMGSWKMCHCMCNKTCDISMMVHHFILLVWFEVIWIKDLGKCG